MHETVKRKTLLGCEMAAKSDTLRGIVGNSQENLHFEVHNEV